MQLIAGKSLDTWCNQYPLIPLLREYKEVFWFNNNLRSFEFLKATSSFSEKKIQDARITLQKFDPLFKQVFPEFSHNLSVFDSPLQYVPSFQAKIADLFQQSFPGKLYVKRDDQLPIAGSVKARGGIYEITAFTDRLLQEKWLFNENSDYSQLLEPKFRAFFNNYTLTVGSTGNLGLSIGILGRKLGYRVTVHLSRDAKQWKKDLLRSYDVEVIEHEGDYTTAVQKARQQAEQSPFTHFIDDETSLDLFTGYSIGGEFLDQQLAESKITVDDIHPLFIYIPCGVGGVGGGITFSLKAHYGKNVHIFFAEPTHCPSMLLGLLTGQHDAITVGDFGIDNRTEADGLACGRPSKIVGPLVGPLISGIYTLSDMEMFVLLALLDNTEHKIIEPSAAAGLIGAIHLLQAESFSHYLHRHHIADLMENATHIAWLTGGSLQPPGIQAENLAKGSKLLQSLFPL